MYNTHRIYEARKFIIRTVIHINSYRWYKINLIMVDLVLIYKMLKILRGLIHVAMGHRRYKCNLEHGSMLIVIDIYMYIFR